jgi:hypothetical protein
MLDIRTPIGLMFLVIGALLAIYGLITPAEMYKISLGYNLNLWWGLAMAAFGALMFGWQVLSPVGAGVQDSQAVSPSGDAGDHPNQRDDA